MNCAEPGVIELFDGGLGEPSSGLALGFLLRLGQGVADLLQGRGQLRPGGVLVLLLEDDVDQALLHLALLLQLGLRRAAGLEDELPLRHEDLGPRHAGARHQHDEGDVSRSRGRDRGDQAPFAMADQADLPGVDLLATLQEGDAREGVASKVMRRR